MIKLKGSRFLVSYEDYETKVFIHKREGYVEVTKDLTDEEKNELIDDLIYAVADLMQIR